MKKTNFKKALSVFLSVLMIMSCWVFVPGEHNRVSAASKTINLSALAAISNGGGSRADSNKIVICSDGEEVNTTVGNARFPISSLPNVVTSATLYVSTGNHNGTLANSSVKFYMIDPAKCQATSVGHAVNNIASVYGSNYNTQQGVTNAYNYYGISESQALGSTLYQNAPGSYNFDITNAVNQAKANGWSDLCLAFIMPAIYNDGNGNSWSDFHINTSGTYLQVEYEGAYGMPQASYADNRTGYIQTHQRTDGTDYLDVYYPAEIYLDKSESLEDAGYKVYLSGHYGSDDGYRTLAFSTIWGGSHDRDNGVLKNQTMLEMFDNYTYYTTDEVSVYSSKENYGVDGTNWVVNFMGTSSNNGVFSATVNLQGTPKESKIGTEATFDAGNNGDATPLASYMQKKNWRGSWTADSAGAWMNAGDVTGVVKIKVTLYDKEALNQTYQKSVQIYDINAPYGDYITAGLDTYLAYHNTTTPNLLKTRKTNQSAINNERTGFENAIKGLVFNANNSALVTAMNNAKAIMDEADYSKKYTQASRTTLETAYNNAVNSVYDTSVPTYQITNLGDNSTWNVGEKAAADQTAINKLTNAINDVVMELQEYSVTFNYNNGSSDTQAYDYGTTITAPSNTTKQPDATNHYIYTWSPAVSTTVTEDATYDEVLNTEAHTWGSWSTALEADCITDGKERRSCTVCGYTEEQNVGVNSSVHNNTTTVAKTDATCTTDGYTEGVWCYNCETWISGHTVIPAAHTPGPAATCTASQTCTVCGEVLAEKLAHTEEVIPAVAATCTKTGLTAGKKCSVCGEILLAQEEIPMAAHTEELVPGKDATCTETGLTDGKICAVCGEILVAQEEIPMAAHTEEIIPAVAPTCTDNGLTAGAKCSVCGKITKAQETDPKLGHDWADTTYSFAADGSSCSAERVCQRADCGVTETATATITSEEKIPATCEEMGTTTYTATFTVDWATTQTKDVKDIPAKNHAWTVSYTWSDDGKTCTATRACGNDAKHNVTATATITSEEKIAATCEEMGTTTYTATFTEDWAATQTKDVTDISAKNHAWTVSYTWSDDGKTCTATRACGNDAKHNVTVEAEVTGVVTDPATCEEKGTTTYTATFTEDWATTQTKDVTDISAKNHDYDRTQSEANLTRPVKNADGTWTNGYYTYTCKNDASHTIEEEVTRADYTGYEAALKNLEDLLKTDITDEAKKAINEAIEGNKLTDNLIDSEQSKINEATENLVKAFEDNNASLKTYTVTFKIEGSTDVVVTVISGQDATAPTNVKKDYDETNHYEFDGWDKAFNNVTSDLTVTAKFKAVEHSYTHTDKDDTYHTDKCDCGYSVDVEHTETSAVTEKATCDADGVRTYTCSVCSGTRTEAIAKRAHNYEDNGVAEKATCLKEGVMNTICTNEETETHAACSHKSTRAITKLDHSYTGEYKWNGADKTHSQQCVNGCDEYGNVTACTFKSEVTAPTCDVDGYTTHTCTVCKNSYEDSYTTRDHIYVYAPGNGTYHEVSCEYDNCSYNATENCSGGTATCVDKAVCEKCKTAWGEVNPNNHVEIVQVGAKEETCTDIGWNAYEHCTKCDYTTYVEIPAKNHAWTVSYAWSDDGQTCTATRACGNDATHNVTVEAKVTGVVTDPATCEEMGTTTYTATFTEDWAAEQTKDVTDIPAKNHDYDRTQSEANLTRPVENADGTWTNGYYTYTCRNDSDHTTTEKVSRADYTEYDKAVEELNKLLNNDKITEAAKTEIRNALTDNAVADNLITSEQDTIDTATDALNAVLDKIANDTTGAYEKVDYTNYNNAVNAYEALDSVMTNADKVAVEAIKTEIAKIPADGSKKDYQTQVDEAAADIAEINAKYGECASGNHDWNAGEVSEAPTCKAEGTRLFTCQICGTTRTETIETVDHKYESYVGNDDATCQKNETETAECAFGCGTKDTREIADSKVDHKYETYVGNDDATCQKNETETAECAFGCGETDTRDIENSTVDHRFTNYVSDNNAECEKDGTKTALCDYGCGTTDTVTDADSATDHDYDETKSEDNLTRPVLVDGVWQDGYYTYTCRNNSEHTTTEKVSRADYTEYDKAVEELNKLLNNDKITEAAKTEIRNVLTDNAVADNLITSEQGTIDTATAALNAVLDKIANDTTGAYEKPDYSEAEKAIQDAENIDGISDADKAIVDELKEQLEAIKNNPESNKTEHQDDVDDIKDAALELVEKYENMCRHNGTTKQYITNIMDDNKQNTHSVKCVDCGEIIKTEKCEFKTETVAATCCTDGYTVYTCKLCGYSFKADIVAADENLHKFGRWYDNEASCKEIRTQTRYCDNPGCFVSETVTVLENGKPAYGAHYYVVVPGRDATCTTDGHTPYYRCVTCDEVTEPERLPAKGHTDGDKNGNCDRCGYIINHQGRCKCFCHNDAFFVRIFFKIVNFFWKLFKINANCECGSVHW